MQWMRFIAVMAGLVCPADSLAQPIRCTGHAHGVFAVAISPDGTLTASCDRATVRIWNTSDGSAVRELHPIQNEAPDRFITDASFSPDGKVLAIAAANDVITFWDTESWERLEKSLRVESPASLLAYSPDGSKLAVSEYAVIRLWDVPSGKPLQSVELDPSDIGRALQVSFSPNGELLSAALQDYGAKIPPSATKVRVWNIASGREVFSAWKGKIAATSVAFSPDGSLLAASADAVELWDLATQKSVRRIEADDRVIFCIAFSPDGATIATGSDDSAIKLWSVESGKLSGTLKGHSGQVHDLCFSNDGKRLVSGGTQETVLIWNLPTDIDKE